MRILFLYTELADYTLACLRALKESELAPEILVVHYPVNPEAPFDFDFHGTGTFINIKDFKTFKDIRKCVETFYPDKIVVSGWSNKWYLRICLTQRRRSVCILTMDNHWKASLKQLTFTFVFRFTLAYLFKKIWVPGNPQKMYASKLGFKVKDIISGFYSCDVTFYSKMGERVRSAKERDFPKRLICVARYIPAKNYELLWEAFIQWKGETNNQWELWCAGIGEDFDRRQQHSAIHHLGFVQKKDWEKVIAQTGIFILPSRFEPWAVAVHEFAAAGFPLILSSKVGAASSFLEKENGWTFDPDDKAKLIAIFKTIESLSPETLNEMGNYSKNIAQRITPQHWAESLLEA